MIDINDSLFKRAHQIIREEYLPYHKQEWFTLDDVCRSRGMNGATPAQYRTAVIKVLSYLSNGGQLVKPLLKKREKRYRLINRDIQAVSWEDADTSDTLEIKWPYGVEDETSFDLGCILVSPGDIFVIAGETNEGKTTFCDNFLLLNMDDYKCTIIKSEFDKGKFKRRICRPSWADPFNEDGTPKFEVLTMDEDFEDAVMDRTDNLIIIDWLKEPGEHTYMVADTIKRIAKYMEGARGICLIAMQKRKGNEYAVGGQGTAEAASVYLSLAKERLQIMKIKETKSGLFNPTGDMFRFKIVEGGTQFHDIHKVKTCPSCHGSGYKTGSVCSICEGKGVIDI